MKVAGKFDRKTSPKNVSRMATMKLALGVIALSSLFATQRAQAQAPYLLPYTIQVLAGGGTSVTVAAGASSACLGAGVTGSQYDSFGDGCPVTSTSVVAGSASDLHDVVVDQQGNVYFLDNSSGNGVVRRIDAHSGVITVFAGSYVSQTGICSGAQDKYGDGCLANDGKANAGTLNGSTLVAATTTGSIGKARGLGINKNGDVFIADYTNSVAHKISAATGIMSMVAGSLASSTKLSSNGGVKGFSGDGTLAFNPAATPTPQGAAMNADRGITADANGDIYIADSGNNVIRVIYNGGATTGALITLTNPTKTPTLGYIYTIVGSDSSAPSAAAAAPAPTTTVPAALPYMADGDGGNPNAALLNVPEDVEVDSLGNLFIADMGIARIRVVYAGGKTVANLISKTNGGITPTVGFIYTIMGSGIAANGVTTPSTTNPAPALATSFVIGAPRKISVDALDNVYVADNGNNVIWFLDASTGYARVIAGTLGATSATTTPAAPLCSAKTDVFGDNCPANTAALSPNSAMGVTVDSQENVYIGDSSNQRLRKVLTNQTFPITAAGAAVTQTLQIHFAAGDSPASTKPYILTGSADFALGTASCTTNADTTQDCLLPVTLTPSIAGREIATLTIASTLNGSADFGLSGIGTASSVAFDPGATSSFATALSAPQGIAQDAAGNTYIADTGNNRVVEFSAAGIPTVVATNLNAPMAVAVTRSGLIYIADTGNNVIRQINPLTGTISAVAGGASAVCSIANDKYGDGCPGTSATLNAPTGLAADNDGNVYVADSGNGLIRELTASGQIVLVGGGASAVCATGDVFGDGCAATAAQFLNPTGIQVDASKNIYIADTGDNLVREIVAATGKVAAIAGTGQAGASGNGSTATGAQLNGPTGLAVDAAGNVYIADTGNAVIRLVNAGIINTAVGTLGAPGTGTLPGSAFAVQLQSPAGVVSNGAGTLVVLDSGNNRAFTDTRTSVTYNFGRTNLGFASPSLQIQETSTGSATTTLGSPLFSPTPAPPFTLAGTSSNGCSTNQTLTPGASCLLTASFTPSASQLGNFNNTYTETALTPGSSPVEITPAPFIALSGVGAVLTTTTPTTIVTTPATGSPQYSIPFVVTTTVNPASCNTAAPSCFPTGTLTFFVDGNQIGLAVAVGSAGTASQSISGLNVGNHTVVAVYSGDLYYASSTATSLIVAVTRGATTTSVVLNPASALQFTAFNMTATVKSQTTNIPTGTFTFYAGTTQIGTAAIDARTGTGTLLDSLAPNASLTPTHYQNYGLVAGTYAVTAVYSGDANYAPSTSAVATLTITADPATFSVSLYPATAGTAQGSTATVVATITANNTLNGTIGFTCTNMPANSICTFGPPTTLSFTATPGVQTEQQINITLFTDVPGGVTQTTSEILGWPILILSCAGILAFRRRLRQNPLAMRLFTIAGLFGILAGGSVLMSGCSSGNFNTQVTPVGTYTVNFIATGPNSTSVSTPITFIVGQGAAGQL